MPEIKPAKAGKWSSATTWAKPGSEEKRVPLATDDVVLDGSFVVKLEEAGVCRSLTITATGLLEHKEAAAAKLTVGTTTAAPSNNAFVIEAGGKYSKIGIGSPIVILKSTSGEEQLVKTGGVALFNVTQEAGTWGWGEDVTALLYKVFGGTFSTNGHNYSGTALEIEAKTATTVNLGAAKIVVAQEWQSIEAGAALTLNEGTSTVELASGAAEGRLRLGGFKLHELVFASSKGAMIKTYSGTVAKLVLNLAGSTEGLAIETELTLTVTESITTNAKSGSLVKLAKTGGGTHLPKLDKASGNVELDWLEVTNVETTNTVSWYAGAHSTLTGSTSFWKAESPGGTVVTGKASGAITLTGTSTATVSSVTTGKATGALLLAGTAAGTLAANVTGKATGTLQLTGTAAGTLRAGLAAKASGAILLTGTAHSNVTGAIQGKAAGAIALTGTAKATVRAVISGKATGALLLTGTSTGTRVSRVTGKSTGTLLLAGTAKGTLAANVAGHATGALQLTGTARSRNETTTIPVFGDLHTGYAQGPSPGRAEGVTTEGER